MELKGYFIAILCLVGGVIGGYLVGSMSFQNQSKSYDLQLRSKEAQIQQLQLQVQILQANITSLQNIIKDLQTPKQTQVRIDTVTWLSTGGTTPTAKGFKPLIRNTGSVAATIESISIRPNTAGSTAAIYKPANPAAVDVRATLDTSGVAFTPTVDYEWKVSNSYVIRVVMSTSFYESARARTPPHASKKKRES